MFLTTPSDRHHIKSAIAGQGCDVWTHVSLTIDFPWYCLSYSSCQAATLGFSGTEFLSNPDQIAELLSDTDSGIQVDQLLLVSPPRLNRTKQWQMEPLAEVWRGQITDNGLYVRLYVLQDGRRYVDAPSPTARLKNLTPLVQYSPLNGN